MKIFLKYGIPPLIPLFLSLCTAIIIATYLPVFNSKSIFDLLPPLPQNHISKFADKGTIYITGTIVSKPEIFNKQSETLDKYQSSYSNNSRRVSFELSVERVAQIENGSINKQNQKVESVDNIKDLDNIKDVDNLKNIDNLKGKKVVGSVQMNVYKPTTEYRRGDTIWFKSKIKSLRNFNNPGGFDYVRYMQNKGLWGRVNANGKDIYLCCSDKSYPNCPNTSYRNYSNKVDSSNLFKDNFSNLYNMLSDFRETFTKHIFNNLKDNESAAILCALTIGNKDFISDDLKADFSKTGGSHILAISGLHLSIVATLFFYLFNLILSCSSRVLVRGWSKKGAALLALFPIVVYAVLSGLSDATQRAMIMVVIFMTAAVIERETDAFNSLAAAGVVILMLDPQSLFTVSFQLSFSAVFFILMGVSLSKQYQFEITEQLNRFNNKSGNKFNFVIQSRFFKIAAGFIFISLCATLGTQVLVMHYFNIFSFSGLIANIVLIPAVGFGGLPLGLAALFFYPFSVSVSAFLVKCAGFILTPCITFIKALSRLPGSYTETFTPDIVEITCYYMFILSLFAAFKSWKKQRDLKQKNQQLLFRLGILGASISLIAFVVNEGVWINKRFFNDNLSITILDVGQGNSALIEMPKGETILVDGGGFPNISSFDTGANIVAPFLRQKKIVSLDAVVLTHPDADHLNGLVYIVEHFKVKRFIKNCDHQNNSAYKNLIAAIEKSGAALIIVDNNTKNMKISSGELHFFNPLQSCSNRLYKPVDDNIYKEDEYKEGKKEINDREDKKEINDNSIVFKLQFGQTSILFPGDITEKAEIEIANRYKNEPADHIKKLDITDIKESNITPLKSDILISPHHGSAGSSSNFFLDMVDPESVIISCGWQNRFGFPRAVVLKRYQNRGIKIFRTDLNGAVTLSSDGTRWKIKSFL